MLKDGKYTKVTVDYKIQAGDIICLNDRAKLDHIETSGSNKHKKGNIRLDSKLIKHECDDLLIIDKPCGLASQSGVNIKTSLD